MIAVAVTAAVDALGNAFHRCSFSAGSYSETISFVMDLQAALELETGQGATFMKNFISHTHLSDNSTLLDLDNHSSHISCEIINICRRNRNFSVASLPLFTSLASLGCFSLQFIQGTF
jgi:hypothetical protein